MWTPRDCAGDDKLKNLKSFKCKCPECGKDAEIFSDEFDKEHHCRGCGKKIDFTRCEIDVSA